MKRVGSFDSKSETQGAHKVQVIGQASTHFETASTEQLCAPAFFQQHHARSTQPQNFRSERTLSHGMHGHQQCTEVQAGCGQSHPSALPTGHVEVSQGAHSRNCKQRM